MPSTEKIFCPECRTDTTYTVKSQKLKSDLKGQEYEYDGHIAYCVNCGNEVWVSELSDANLDALYSVYRKQNNLITPKMIVEILDKYNIGKRPLSLLLGWGEHTVSRYLEGGIPSKDYSDEFMKIYNEPDYYLSLLERNKSNLASQLTYSKSRSAAEKYLGLNNKTPSTIDIAVRYLLYKSEDITHLSLQKALYYIQGFYFAFNNEFLFSEDCEAWVHGPVYRSVYYKYSDYKYEEIEKPIFIDDSIFTNMEKLLFDSVVRYFCCFSGKILEDFTHMETPWLRARKDLKINESSDRIIPKEDIGRFFVEKKDKYGMTHPGDISMYSLDMFNKVNR
jgi:putative zinc finger/helix-turn-helix YgiT family protein